MQHIAESLLLWVNSPNSDTLSFEGFGIWLIYKKENEPNVLEGYVVLICWLTAILRICILPFHDLVCCLIGFRGLCRLNQMYTRSRSTVVSMIGFARKERTGKLSMRDNVAKLRPRYLSTYSRRNFCGLKFLFDSDTFVCFLQGCV